MSDNTHLESFIAESMLIGSEIKTNQYVSISQSGKIDNIRDRSPGDECSKIYGLIIPGLVNSHSHAFQVLLRGRKDNPSDFDDWVKSALCRLVKDIRLKEIEAATTAAYAQMLRNGITSVGEFHYLHNMHQQDEAIDGANPLTHKIIQVAKKVGIRLRLLYCGYDLGTKKCQERFHRSVKEVIRSLNSLRTEFQDDDLINIGAAPHSLHGASEEMITEMIHWAEKFNEPVHIHLAEQQSQLGEIYKKYNQSPVEFLKSRSLLVPNLSIVHGIWISPAEIKILAENNISHVYNPYTNMALGDGIAPITEYIEQGVKTAVGTDANISLDLFKEIRMVEWLQRINSLEMGITAQTLKKIQSPQSPGHFLLDMGTTNGAKSLDLKVGELKAGYFADFLVLDNEDWSLRRNGDYIDQIISSMETQNCLKQVYVGGKLRYDKEKGFINFDEMYEKSIFNKI